MSTQRLQRPTMTVILFVLLVIASGNDTLLASSFQPDSSGTDLSQGSTETIDDSDTFFDDSTVHEIYLTFDAGDYGAEGWYSTLYDSHANDADDPYFPASFSGDGVTIDTVGVRFKGNSSFNANSVKKSFKIDFDEYDEDNDELVFYDLKKLNLNNGYKDPTMLREKLFLDFAGEFVAAPRAVHTKVYVNGEYYGLYTAVEQVDKTFVQNRFGDDEDGNLFKGASSDAADANDDFGSDLTWLGSDETAYYDNYVLKTNETANDYSQLVDFIDVLNNTSAADFPTALEPLFDVDDGLQGLALNNLFVNLDSYNGSAHNYYLYDRDDTGKMTHIPWDTNESFGRFTMYLDQRDDPLTLDPFWLPTATRPGENEERPLMENLWANDDYSNDYLCDLQQMLDAGFDATSMQSRIDELADLIRTDLYADPNKLYSSAQFESNLTNNIQDGRETIYGLRYFVQERSDYLQSELGGYTLDCAPDMVDLSGILFVNEFMAENDTTLQDPDGTGHPDWFEIYNAGSEEIDLQGLYLTDDLTDPTQHAITQTLTAPAGGYLTLYADNDTEQGADHIGFKLGASGEDLVIYNSDGVTLIDSYTFGEQTADTSEGRCPDGGDTWTFFSAATPGASNEPCGTAPAISDVDHSPAPPTAADDVTITATITDDVTVASASLWYSVGGGYTELTMADAGSNVYAAVIPAQADDTTVTYYIEAADNEGFTTSDPANAPTNTHSYTVGYDAPTLYVNELMADNDTILEDPDEAGSYPDWIELYNPGTEAIDLGGFYLTDDLTEPTQFQIPTGVTIAGGGFLLFYADNDTEQGDQHTNFKLSADGESVALFGTDGVTQIDAFTFITQTTDVAYGRCPDGGAGTFFSVATPGANNASCNAAPVITDVTHSPLSPTSRDDVTVTATITDDVMVNSASLWYSIGDTYTALTMADTESNSEVARAAEYNSVYAAIIPAQADGATVSYYIEAADDEGLTTTEPVDAPSSIYTYTVNDSPLEVITIENREVTLENGVVRLSWETVDESSLVAFNLYRYDDSEEPVKITLDSIAAQFAGQPLGASYIYEDHENNGQASRYELEMLRLDGGVILLDMGSAQVSSKVFLPIVVSEP